MITSLAADGTMPLHQLDGLFQLPSVPANQELGSTVKAIALLVTVVVVTQLRLVVMMQVMLPVVVPASV